MTRYLVLIHFTDHGIQNLHHSIDRAQGFGKSIEEAGGKVISLYWAVGEADGCIVFESPDEQTGASLLLSLAKDGNVRTRTMTLYTQQEFQQVLEKT